MVIVIFALFAVLVMLLGAFGAAIFPTRGTERGTENVSPHSPNGIPGAVDVYFIESGLTSGTYWSVAGNTLGVLSNDQFILT